MNMVNFPGKPLADTDQLFLARARSCPCLNQSEGGKAARHSLHHSWFSLVKSRQHRAVLSLSTLGVDAHCRDLPGGRGAMASVTGTSSDHTATSLGRSECDIAPESFPYPAPPQGVCWGCEVSLSKGYLPQPAFRSETSPVEPAASRG